MILSLSLLNKKLSYIKRSEKIKMSVEKQILNSELFKKLIDKCISLININGYTKIKKSLFNNINVTNIPQLNKILCKYDNHTYIRPSISHTSFPRSYLKIEEDKLPIILQKKNYVIIKVFNINAPNYEKFKYKTYATGTNIGKRTVKIVNLIKNAIHNNSNILIDLRNCGGGDERVFYDAFGELVGTGILYYTKKNIGGIFYCVRNKSGKIKYMKVKPNLKRKSIKGKNVKILVGLKTGSSAEFITMILKDSINAKIIGGKTAGYLTLTDEKVIRLQNKKYILSITISKTLYDSSGKKYNGYFENNLKRKNSKNFNNYKFSFR